MADFLVLLHVVFGVVALLGGAAASLSRKGGAVHVLAGRVFGWAMVTTAATAIVVASLRPNGMLLGVGAFSLYLVVSGATWIRLGHDPERSGWVRGVGAYGVATAIALAGVAYLRPDDRIVLGVFSAIVAALSVEDLRKAGTQVWTPALHAGRMGGAYIGAVTAFAVVNVDFLPDVVVWLTPTAIGAPLIAMATRRFERSDQSAAD